MANQDRRKQYANKLKIFRENKRKAQERAERIRAIVAALETDGERDHV